MKAESSMQAFIVGTGRCGSTLLSEIVREFSRGLSISEIFSVVGPLTLRGAPLDGEEFWRLLNEANDDLWSLVSLRSSLPEVLWRTSDRTLLSPLRVIPLPHLDMNSDEVLGELRRSIVCLPRQSPAAQFSAFFDRLRSLVNKEYWVERSGGSLEYVADLIGCWPSAKVVHVFRTGTDCAASMSRHPFFRLRVARMLMHDENLPASKAFELDISIERFGAYWSAVTIRGIRALSRLPRAQVLHLSYEDLLYAPVSTVREILQFFGEGSARDLAEQELTGRIRSRPSPLSTNFTSTQLAALARACRPGENALREIREASRRAAAAAVSV